MSYNRKFLLSFIVCILLATSASFSYADDVKVGIYQNPPLVGLDEEKIPTGFFVELMTYIANENDIKINYEFDTLNNSFEKIENGELDLVLAVAYSEERDAKFIYNEETVYTNWGQVYSGVHGQIESFQDLEGLKLGVERGDIHYDSSSGIKGILEEFSINVEYVEFDGRVEMLTALENSKIDAAVVSRLFGEYYESNYDIKITPIQFNPIKIKIIAVAPENQYLLNTFDEGMNALKKDPTSIYYQALNSLLGTHAKPRVPQYIRRIVAALTTMLIGALVAVWIGRSVIKRQKKKILDQNEKLKKLVHHISELRNIPTMDELFETLVNQLKDILGNDEIEVASLIEYEDGIRLDSKPFVTEKLKPFEHKYISEAPFRYFDMEAFLNFKLSGDRIRFGERCVVVKFDSSYNLNGYLYIELSEPARDREFLQIYLSDIMTNLQKIIVNIRSLEEKTKLFISLGELIEKRDHEVSNHVKRVSEATKLLAEASGFSEERISNIVIASSVHDIGKIFVPDQILNKPGKLTPEEFDIIKAHTTNELKIMDDAGESLSKSVHEIVRYHHENWDGTGYPEGLSGSDIPLDARIVSIIDVFEALTHDRPYKKAWSFEEAETFIAENSGVKFDPDLVQTFLTISKEIEAVFIKYNS